MAVRPVRSMEERWKVYNPDGKYRVVVTKNLVGELWLDVLRKYDCRVEVCSDRGVLPKEEILDAIGNHCDGVIGQLTEDWSDTLFSALKRAGVSTVLPAAAA